MSVKTKGMYDSTAKFKKGETTRLGKAEGMMKLFSLTPLIEYKEWVQATYGRKLESEEERIAAYKKYRSRREKDKYIILNQIAS